MAPTETDLTKSRTDVLLRITQAIETAATLDELLLLSLNELSQLFEVTHSSIMLLHEDGSGQIVCEFPPHVSPPNAELIGGQTQLARAIRQRQLLQINIDEYTHTSQPLASFFQQRGVVSALVVPLVSQDKTIGLLFLDATTRLRCFHSDETDLARLLASQLAAAIVAFRTTEKARRRGEELATLNEIATTVTSTLDTHEVYLLVVQKLNEYFKVDAGSLLLINESTGNLDFVMTIEGGEEKLAGFSVPMGQGVVGYVAETGKTAIVHDAQNDPRFYRDISESVGYVTRSILCVPLVAKGRVIGAVELLNKINGQFTEDDAQRLSRMAAFIGVAIENARLFKQVADGRDRLEAILNSTSDGILMADMQGRVLSANPMAEQIFDTLEAQLIGQTVDTLLNDLHSRAHEVVVRAWINSVDHTPLSATEIELGGVRRRFIRHLTLPVRDVEGELYAQLVLLRDITQEKELEQLREDYTGMLVHDLRAPLTSIMNGIMMVNRGLGGPVTPQQRELLGIAHQGSQTVLELINNLLDISKMEQGRMSLDLEPLSPYALTDDVIERLSVSARSRSVAIEQQLALGIPPIEADRDKILRVLQNLLDNALKFSPTKGVVTLGASLYNAEAEAHSDLPLRPPLNDGSWLIFWVQDRGLGIPAAYHERIFEKFGQVRGRKLRGTGLGLTFCKLAVEAHTGKIWLESREGEGSVFAFALPYGVEQHALAPARDI